MMEFTFKNITDFLAAGGIKFSVAGTKPLSDNLNYILASTRNKIECGLYYVTTESIGSSDTISNSIIITDQPGQLSSNNLYIIVSNSNFHDLDLTSIHVLHILISILDLIHSICEEDLFRLKLPFPFTRNSTYKT